MDRSSYVERLRLIIGSDNKIRVYHTLKTVGDFAEVPIDLAAEKRRYILMWTDMLRENRLVKRYEFETLGASLYSVLLENRIGEILNRVLFEGRVHDKVVDVLRVELEFAENQQELASWPWEYLFCRETGIFLAESRRLVLIRSITMPLAPRTLQVNESPIRVLFVVASPTDLAPVPYESVLESIKDLETTSNFKVATLTTSYKENDLLSPEYVPQAARRNLIQIIEKFQPHVIHFIGHGRYNNGNGQLALMGIDSNADWVDDHLLATWLMSDLQLRLVFLQACESGFSSYNPYQDFSGVANHLTKKNIPAVIAMQYKIVVGAANQFARAFYEALAISKSVGEAVQDGRLEVQSRINADEAHRYAFCLPVLYINGSDESLKPPLLPSFTLNTEGTLPKNQSLLISCPRCGHSSTPLQKYCRSCGFALLCPKCYARVEHPDQYCANCGGSLFPSPDAKDVK